MIQTRRQSHDENGTVQWLVTRTVYDAAGRVSVTTDEYLEGTTAPIWGTRTSYDAAGRVTTSERLKGVEITFSGTADALESVLTTAGTVVSTTTTAYDNAGRAVSNTDQYGNETRNTYNRVGNVVETRTETYDETGTLVWRVTRTVYDKCGRTAVATDPFLISADGLETVLTPVVMGTRTVYDEFGRAAETRRLGGVVVNLTGGETSVGSEGTVISVSKTVYNQKGQVAQSIAADGQITDYEYDHLGRQTAVVGHALPAEEVGLTGYAAGTKVRLRTETVYDDHGRVQTERTNIRQIIAPDGTVTIDAAGVRETSHEYDEFGNVVKTTFADPDGAAGPLTRPFVTATFDALGRKTSDTDPMRLTDSLEYDLDGRLKAVVLPQVPDPQNGGTPISPRWEYGYDAFGNQTLIRDKVSVGGGLKVQRPAA